MLYNKLLVILSGRGITLPPPAGALELRDDADGRGPYIAVWDAARLGGAVPTQAEIDAITDAQAAAAVKDVQAADVDSNLLIQAVAQVDFEERQKLQVKAGQTLLTAAQTKARIKTIYRNLLS